MPTSTFQPDPRVIALGIKQPWAELILRGVKTIEVRTLNTQVRGLIYLYASQKLSSLAAAHDALRDLNLNAAELPTGRLVGSVEIVSSRLAKPQDVHAACVPAELLERCFAWELRHPQRFAEPVSVRYLPFGTWFYPFVRKSV